MTWLGIKHSLGYILNPISCMSPQEWPANLKDICTLNAVMFSSKCETFRFTGSLRLGGGTVFKVGGHKCTSKKLEKFYDLNWQLTSQALKYDTFISMSELFYSKFDKPSTIPIYTTPYLSCTTLTWAHKCN